MKNRKTPQRSSSEERNRPTAMAVKRFHIDKNGAKTVKNVDDFHNPNLPYLSVSKHYSIKVLRDYFSRHLNVRAKDWQVHFNDLENLNMEQSMETVGKILENLIAALTKYFKPDNLVRFILRSPSLDKPISIPLVSIQEGSVEMLLAHIGAVAQSK